MAVRASVGAAPMNPTQLERVRGCLIGGAIGDALGAPTEFLSLSEIEARWGPGGVTGFEPAYSERGEVTDDTQMTLFTAEGLVDASDRGGEVVAWVWIAYRRWYRTQVAAPTEVATGHVSEGESGLLAHRELWEQRGPGNTCLGALGGGVPGSRSQPLNDSKGCGGVMRVAPVGLVASDATAAYELGCDTAALTHGHRCGWASAGAMAVMIHELMAGADLGDAIIAGRDSAAADPTGTEVASWIDAAIAWAEEAPVDGRRIDAFGAGWVGEEALAIAVGCVWKTPDPSRCMLDAVNHSGDTDSTGALAGQLLGAAHGIGVFRPEWVRDVELRPIIDDIAGRLADLHPMRWAGRARRAACATASAAWPPRPPTPSDRPAKAHFARARAAMMTR
ncbi:MAG: ADP-ribosylglycohydrolase family protein [Acidimicrobiales bacterium]